MYACGFTHATRLTIPFTVMGLLESYSAENEWWAHAAPAERSKLKTIAIPVWNRLTRHLLESGKVLSDCISSRSIFSTVARSRTASSRTRVTFSRFSNPFVYTSTEGSVYVETDYCQRFGFRDDRVSDHRWCCSDQSSPGAETSHDRHTSRAQCGLRRKQH